MNAQAAVLSAAHAAPVNIDSDNWQQLSKSSSQGMFVKFYAPWYPLFLGRMDRDLSISHTYMHTRSTSLN